MYQLIESIKVKENRILNLSYHERRMNRSLRKLSHLERHNVPFDKLQKEALALEFDIIYKLRIVYDGEKYEYSFLPYEIRFIESLQVCENIDLDYQDKLEDRHQIEKLKKECSSTDDILITQNGAICDTSYCNVAFCSNGQWFTPESYLLNGTKRQILLDSLIITPKEIYVEDIPDYKEVCLFNAMIEFGEVILPTSKIII